MNPHQLMADLAKTLGMPALTPDDQGSVALCFSDGDFVQICISEADAQVLLFTDVAPMPVHDGAEVAAVLLTTNVALVERGLNYFALDPQLRRIVLCRTLGLDGLQAATLRWQVDALRAQARAMRDELVRQRLPAA